MKITADKPLTADHVETDDGRFTFYVYDSARSLGGPSSIFEWPYTRDDESSDDFMTEAELRELAEAATWAADRLAAKRES